MQFHQNCRKQRPKLSMAASGRLNYAAKAYQKGGTRFQLGTETVLPGETKALFTSEGYGYISMLSLEIPQTHDSVYLAVHSHGAKQIDLPVRNMFMSGIDGRETQSMFAGKYVEESGAAFFYRNLFLPYEDGCRIELFNIADTAVTVTLKVQYTEMKQPVYYGLHSQAQSFLCEGKAAQMGEAVTVAHLRGSGTLHSLQMSLFNPLTRGMYMEGNIEIYIDGALFPEYQSTGTEEFFMGGVYFANLHNSAYSCCTRTFNDGEGNPDHVVSACRYFIEDPITFQSSLKLVWHNGQARQGPVLGPTSYSFSGIYYLDRPVKANPLFALEAAYDLSLLDGNRNSLALKGKSGMLQSADSITFDGPGTLERFYLSLDSSAQLQTARISLTIDDRELEELPLSAFFETDGQLCVKEGSGCTGKNTVYKILDIQYRSKLRIRLIGAPGVYYTEYREGSRDVFETYAYKRIICSGVDHRHPYMALAGEGEHGGIDSIISFSGAPGDCVCEVTETDEKPTAVIGLGDLLLLPERLQKRQNSYSRSFRHAPFLFHNGLKIRTVSKGQPGAMVVFYRTREAAQTPAPHSIPSLLSRLNNYDLAPTQYEGRCYNATEGEDGLIPAGKTGTIMEDFSAGILTCIRFGTPPVGSALHEAVLDIFLGGSEKPAVHTSCARFFSAAYHDPVFWSNTQKLSRLSKLGWNNPKNKGQHSSFFRYLALPYQNGIKITLTAPKDSDISGFNNVYYLSARAGGEDFAGRNDTHCESLSGNIVANASTVLANAEQKMEITSIQLTLEGVSNSYLSSELCLTDGQGREKLKAPLYSFFCGAPANEVISETLGEYTDIWKKYITDDEGYFSGPDVGWVRRGKGPGYRDVMYRLMDAKPIIMEKHDRFMLCSRACEDFSFTIDMIMHHDGRRAVYGTES